LQHDPTGAGDGSGEVQMIDSSREIDALERAGTAGDARALRHPIISVVIPLYNEEGSLEELAQRLETTLKGMVGDDYEVIFIDDGSRDNSFGIIRTIHARPQSPVQLCAVSNQSWQIGGA
jgi:cellulose synthase/poly-beta-1,6-N-acetylglucosamine synthase-like glycosyltransferase